MHDTAKYLIHADITADGVVERSDVVGAVFGQTEGLLGDDLDLRDLQDSSKVGRIDVEIDSRQGQSFGEITIATSLDKVETAILAAALETIDRVGPCRSTIDVESIEDVRAAKRREVVERAKALLEESFDGTVLSSAELVDEVRRAVRVEDITEYEGYPAGPRVADSDAVVVVEGRADVLQLLKYGVKNAVAVEGTNVPDEIAALTRERTVTAFLDGDRGGDLILKELAKVGEVDFVAFAPEDKSVEDLDRGEVTRALREKVPYELVAGDDGAPDAEGSPGESAATDPDSEAGTEPDPEPELQGDGTDATTDDTTTDDADTDGATDDGEPATRDDEPTTLGGHIDAVVDAGTARFLSVDLDLLAEVPAEEVFARLRDAPDEDVPETVVLDGEADQRLLDVAAQRGVGEVVATSTGEFVKQPTSVRVRTADELRRPAEQ
jgi:5S rRNA maturation endonuclease (ribonuclease M5)